MSAQGRKVKGAKRSYDATGRRARAVITRARVVDAAETHFLRDGYAATTVAAVAIDAGVSVDTVYKAFGGKPGLVRAVRDRALLGAGPIPAEQRSDALHSAHTDPRLIVEGWAALATEVAPRGAPIMLLVRDAAHTDPDVAALAAEMDHDRWVRMRHNAEQLSRGGHLRPGVTIDHAADVLWTYSSSELYELLVLNRHWSLDSYARFIADGISGSLL
jgi:AcrR family transcriptional regulator